MTLVFFSRKLCFLLVHAMMDAGWNVEVIVSWLGDRAFTPGERRLMLQVKSVLFV